MFFCSTLWCCPQYKAEKWVLVHQCLGSVTLPRVVPLASVCADGFHAGEIPPAEAATWEAEFQLLSPTNRSWLEERHGVLGLGTAGAISSINDKLYRWITVKFALILWHSAQTQLD